MLIEHTTISRNAMDLVIDYSRILLVSADADPDVFSFQTTPKITPVAVQHSISYECTH